MSAPGRLGRRRVGGDAGASLVVALALMTFLGLVTGALATYGATSLRATKATSGRASQGYDVDGAVQTAINQVRNSNYNNDVGQTCRDLTFPGAAGAAVTVTCTGATGTGAVTEPVPVTARNRPAQAILALGTNPGEPGILQRSSNVLRIQGQVFSNGSVDSGSGTLQVVNSQVVARGTCSGTVLSSDAQGYVVPNNCSAADLIPADPDYPQPAAGLVYRPLPSCDTGSTVEFSPGYYDDAVGLSAMMSGTGACRGKTFLFRPAAGGVGLYYFDFHNGEGGGLPAGSRVWTVDDQSAFVIGGTPRGWVPDVSAPVVDRTFPGSCVSPLRSTANNGVEFVFGGDSRLRLRAGSVELCGQYSPTGPPVAVYGAKLGADIVSGPVTATTDGTGQNPGSTLGFLNPALITATDGNAAIASLDASLFLGDLTASVLVTGLAPPTPVPAGSVLTAAKLLVVHRDNNGVFSRMKSLGVTVTPTRAGAAALANTPQPTIYQDGVAGVAYHTDTLDLTDGLGPEVHTNGFTGLQVRYDATVGAANTVAEYLDSIQLVLSWRPPAVRGQTTVVNGTTNCLGTYPGGCELLETQSGSTALYIQGTVYAPYAALDINLANASAQVFRCGLIVRSLQLQLTNSASFAGPLIEIPNDSSGPVPLEVYFRAYLSGRLVGTARVRFPASDPSAIPTPGHRNVEVLSWTVRRR